MLIENLTIGGIAAMLFVLVLCKRIKVSITTPPARKTSTDKTAA